MANSPILTFNGENISINKEGINFNKMAIPEGGFNNIQSWTIKIRN